MLATWREHQYRKMYGLTHWQYVDEPGSTVDWAIALSDMEADMEKEALEREKSKGAR